MDHSDFSHGITSDFTSRLIPRSFMLIHYFMIVGFVDHQLGWFGRRACRGNAEVPEGARVGAGSTAGRVFAGGRDGWWPRP